MNPTAYHLPAAGKPLERPPLRKIAVEEHFNSGRSLAGGDGDIAPTLRAMAYERQWVEIVQPRLCEFNNQRVAGMDASGIEMAILSHTLPGVQALTDREQAVAGARDINDFLAEVVGRHPDRYAGFAHVALQDPVKAADELERTVRHCGFKGAMVNGYTNLDQCGAVSYLDEPRYAPFWEAAAALNVPIYLHPRPPADRRAFEGHPEMLGAAWGFGIETATHALRLVFSGLFDCFPRLTIVLGHLGEGLPYAASRIQHCFEFNPAGKRLRKRLQDYLCENVFITTSGNFNDQALIAAMLTVGADRILFAVDYPYETMEEGARWLEDAPISELDRRKIAAGNARALFGL